MSERKWIGGLPSCCDICEGTFDNGVFYDARSEKGPWAIMDERCYGKYGVGLGTGYGQQYDARTGKKLAG